ncbi:uncharacterized protein VTP21DRAFT_1447 [Calcarisporiella thermophila]|uniref:uncharacterized protein n=1 Tax=Calcarisporiella thermophila TaxID=911321 RepID=UPI003743B65F
MPPSASDTKNDNIRVVVRCRGRNEREIRENSPIIISTQAVRGREVVVRSNPADMSSSKTYTFDSVFGPDADQSVIFDHVVAPMLQEVPYASLPHAMVPSMAVDWKVFRWSLLTSNAYCCRYTMEGDLEIVDQDLSANSGIIPRALQTLFATLEAEQNEFSVRVSCIELYNEELKDLLSVYDDKRLQLFEDAAKKGVHIQGLEEVCVNSAHHGINLLRQSSNKRRIAMTKCNDKSSRSHTVFTLTTHIKESTATGEDLLKVGKLNLVDLAGSENIGRSGAESMRAREAGMINQSLLTLGRVINALVENSPHIPYRESKLTRLLRDSLGGRTKTCIVATISPARLCIDETMSTLDYASRAKNIRNMPEVNQRMTTKMLIKEYLKEIDRLQADLTAVREKHGIYLSQDSYQQLMEENTSRKQQVDEMRRNTESIQHTLRQTEEKFQHNMKLLVDTRAELSGVKQQLLESAATLKSVRTEATEERLLRKVHENREHRLEKMATELASTLGESVRDTEGLREKLDRKEGIETNNRLAFEEFRESLRHHVSQAHEILKNFNSTITTQTARFEDELTTFRHLQREAFEDNQRQLHENLTQFTTEFERANGVAGDRAAARVELQRVVEGLAIEMREKFDRQYAAMQQSTDERLREMCHGFQQGWLRVEEQCREMRATLGSVVKQLNEAWTSELAILETKQSELETIVGEVIPDIERHGSTLFGKVDSHLNESTRLTKDFLLRMEDMVNNFMDTQRRDVRAITSELESSLKDRYTKLKHSLENNRDTTREGLRKMGRLLSVAVDNLNHVQAGSDSMMDMLCEGPNEVDKQLGSLGNRLSEDARADGEALLKGYGKVTEAVSHYLSSSARLDKEFESHLTPMAQHVNLLWEKSHQKSQNDLRKAEDLVDLVLTKSKETTQCCEDMVERVSVKLGPKIDSAEDRLTKRLKLYEATGATPPPRHYPIPTQWYPPRPNAELLSEWRARGNVHIQLCEADKQEVITADSPSVTRVVDDPPSNRKELEAELDTRDAKPSLNSEAGGEEAEADACVTANKRHSKRKVEEATEMDARERAVEDADCLFIKEGADAKSVATLRGRGRRKEASPPDPVLLLEEKVVAEAKAAAASRLPVRRSKRIRG